ncbi:MAG: hypothetical protein D6780_01210, partial [Candidatus Dadabacteria bacterium]
VWSTIEELTLTISNSKGEFINTFSYYDIKPPCSVLLPLTSIKTNIISLSLNAADKNGVSITDSRKALKLSFN